MGHNCRLGTIEVNEDKEGYLFIKYECYMPFGIPHTLRIEYCPICGEKSKKSNVDHHKLYAKNIPILTEYAMSIEQMNKNIECIKAFMMIQNSQNECFIFTENELKKRIEALENKKTT